MSSSSDRDSALLNFSSLSHSLAMNESDTTTTTGRLQEHSTEYLKLPPENSLTNSLITHEPVHALFGRRLLKRSNGRSLLSYSGLPGAGVLGVVKDGFTTLINLQLYWVFIFFCSLYVLSWLGFALIWWGVVEAYGPIGERNLSCVENVHNFPTAFLFSLETEVTIGYGHKFIRAECGAGIVLLVVQCLVGLLIDSLLLGLIFAKITRPRNRRKTLLFSDRAVIYTNRKNQKVLEFRIANIRTTQLVEAHVRLQLYWNKKEEASDDTELQVYDLDVGYDTGRDRIFLLTPICIQHVITSSSPLAELTEENILTEDLEIVVILEGIVESTGLTAQALWSYTQQEIFFNYKFVPMVYRHSTGNRRWEVDFKRISHTVKV